MSLEIKTSYQVEDFNLDVDLKLPRTGINSIFGPSGCGKTTLLRIIAGLNNEASARIKVGDSVWQDEGTFLKAFDRRVGYVFQEPSLFSHLSVRENFLYGYKRVPPSERLISIEKVIELLGLEKIVNRGIAGLSGGEQQRVSIARALLSSPELLLMDEPLSGLDLKRKKEIMPYMENLSKELSIPIIYVTHSIDEVARLANELVFMKDGKIESSGAVFDQLAKIDDNYAIHNLVKGKVLSFDENLFLGTISFGNSTFLIPGESFEIGRTIRIQIKAKDISITLSKQKDTSILNILEAKVDSLSDYQRGQSLIKVMVGETILTAILTNKSVRDLKLEVGQNVFVQIKSASLIG